MLRWLRCALLTREDVLERLSDLFVHRAGLLEGKNLTQKPNA